jgi:hypothetical protein
MQPLLARAKTSIRGSLVRASTFKSVKVLTGLYAARMREETHSSNVGNWCMGNLFSRLARCCAFAFNFRQFAERPVLTQPDSAVGNTRFWQEDLDAVMEVFHSAKELEKVREICPVCRHDELVERQGSRCRDGLFRAEKNEILDAER